MAVVSQRTAASNRAFDAVKHFFFESHDEEQHDHILTDAEKDAALPADIARDERRRGRF